MPGPGLDEAYEDPCYLAGRIMAVLGRIQYTASRTRGDQKKNGINTTFEDRYLAGAIANPKIAIIQGLQQAQAWLRKIRQGRPGAAVALQNELNELFERYGARTEFPGRTTSNEQSTFILGYYHQRAHDIRQAKKQSAKGGRTELGDLPEIDEPTDDTTHIDPDGATHD